MNDMLTNVEQLFRRLTREIWIITAAADGRRSGLTATWVSPAALDPQRPLLLVSLGADHFTRELVSASGTFAAHLLRTDQGELAWNFSRDTGRERDKFASLSVRTGSTGSPLLSDCLACLETRVVATYEAGDRFFFWGEVVACQQALDAVPLTDQGWFPTLADEQRKQLFAHRQADIGTHRERHEAWLQGQGE
jgi:flavin reductase (DIM6/NTAB) family NADH-FMN oxidoreductase RutF